MLCIFKFCQISDSFSKWFVEEMRHNLEMGYRLSVSECDTLYVIAMYGSSKVLTMIQNPYMYTTDDNLLGISKWIIELFAHRSEMFIARNITDLSEPYSIVASICESKRYYKEADAAYIKLYKIVAERDGENERVMSQLARDIYEKIMKRKQMGLQEQYRRYVRFGLQLCEMNPYMPDDFREAIKIEYNL